MSNLRAGERVFRQVELALSEQLLIAKAAEATDRLGRPWPELAEFHFIPEHMAITASRFEAGNGAPMPSPFDRAAVRFADVRVIHEAPSMAKSLGPFWLHKMTYRGESFHFTGRTGLGFKETTKQKEPTE